MDLRPSLCFDVELDRDSVALVGTLEKRLSLHTKTPKTRETALELVADALVFAGVLIVSALAIAAIALVTPLVIALSILIGFFGQKDQRKAWRSAGA